MWNWILHSPKWISIYLFTYSKLLTIGDDGTTCYECTNGTIPHENEQCQIIDNCRKYEDGLYCSECIDDYSLSYDRKKCVKYDNCRELDKNNRCQLCAKHYKLIA